jgi:pyrroloquinoline quinone biosynthesis protein B
VKLRLLGASAGGGVPQWNCACAGCIAARAGRIPARTQASAAVSADGERWYLLHATPDVRAQIEACPPLHPRPPRASPIAGVLLANGDLDATLGLLQLREDHPLAVYATATTARGFTTGNVLHRTLERFPGHVAWHPLALDVEHAVGDLRVTALALPGKVPLHLAGLEAPSPEDNVGLRIRDGRHTIVWAPCVAGPSPALDRLLAGADVILFDGTFWSLDEHPRAGGMAHWPVQDSLPLLARAPGRRVLVHVNNTNPLLLDEGPVRAAGVEVGVDGQELL